MLGKHSLVGMVVGLVLGGGVLIALGGFGPNVAGSPVTRENPTGMKSTIPNDSVHANMGNPILNPRDMVETVDGRLIPQVNRDGVRGELYPKCLTCHGDLENATLNMGFDLDCVFCHWGRSQLGGQGGGACAPDAACDYG